MTALRKALAALFLVFATVAFALTPGERIVLFSGIHPVWQANFLGASSLPAGLTFSRSTTATYFNSSGVLSTAAINAPRFDYNPSTLAPAGLLVEEQRINYAQYSQNFGTGWTSPAGATTITTSTGVKSPDGSSDMALLTQTSTSGLIYGNSTGQTTTGTNYVSSVYFKAGASSPAPYFEVAFTDVSGSYAYAIFNSSTGAYVSSAAARGSIVSYGSTPIGNGIYRAWVVASFTTITAGLRSLLNPASDSSGNTVAGQTGYAWGAQIELGSFPTSYIPNSTASTVTRTADVVTPTTYASKATIWQSLSESAGTTARTYYAPGALPSPFTTGYWYQSMAAYPRALTTAEQTPRLVVGAPY